MSDPVRDIIINRDRDCTGCRLVSGFGLVGAGTYVCYYAKINKNTNGRPFVFLIGAGFLYLGAARLLQGPPFQEKFKQHSINTKSS